ncbi:hypothetical protein ABMA27_012221 [Loxostege sticticalis]|uniref:Uncharacterized protein n=1 Tax=Loxostege sticticalis TaxID=481309 RepID=A0ABR3H0J2_LOXSC
MLNLLSLFTTLSAPVFVATVSVNIDGVIDLGPNWHYEYQVKEGKSLRNHEKSKGLHIDLGKSDKTKDLNLDLVKSSKSKGLEIDLGNWGTTKTLNIVLGNSEKTKSPKKKSRAKKPHSKKSKSKTLNIDLGMFVTSKKPKTDSENRHKKEGKDSKNNVKSKHLRTEHKETQRQTTVKGIVTQSGVFDPPSMFEEPHSVKEDKKINEFTYHVYKQSLKVFDEIRKKVDPAVEHKVETLARNYDTKFREFINETLNQKIKTRLGSQRVVLNIIETSNQLLKRLVNHFIGDLNRGSLRSKAAAVNVFQKAVERESELELRHACNKFGFCRTSAGFSSFMINFFTIIIKTDDRKNKQAADAVTEVLKNTDFSNIMEPKTVKRFKHAIEVVEKLETDMVRAMFMIAKNVFAMKNRPLNVMVKGSEHINKTVALMEIVDELDKRLPSNDENQQEWDSITEGITDWSEGKRHDILEYTRAKSRATASLK